MKKLILAALLCTPLFTPVANAGWFAQASESYLIYVRKVGGNMFQCTYKTNPGNRGEINFNVHFNGGCPRFVHYNAQTGAVTVPR